MSQVPSGRVTALNRYPVKGLSPEPLESVDLHAGQGFPCDRMLGFLRHDTPFDPAHFEPMPKTRFHMLARDGALARLKTRYDMTRDVLTIGESDFDLATPTGQSGAENAIGEALGLAAADRPRLVRGENHRFTDVSVVSETFMNAVSLISLTSVNELAAKVDRPLDPLRFRGNIVFDGWPAFAELELVDRTIAIGPVRLVGLLRTKRCAATTVNPETGVPDVFVPRHLQENYGHADLGLYAEVVEGGTIRPGDTITVL